MSPSDKNLVKKLHNNLGHPSCEDFVRALRMARARTEVIKFIKEEFKCELCEAHQLPKAARPATLPKSFQPGKVVGVDVVYMPSEKARKNVPVLNIVDWGTCYQMLEPLEEGTAAEQIWKAFMRSWGRVFGTPEVTVVDQGREFLGGFSKKLNESGSIVRTIGARSPWQQGRTERHGGLAKGMLQRVVDQTSPTTRDEWCSCVFEVEKAKNRLHNRSGYSPAQRQIGLNVRIPGSLSSDDPYDAVMMRSTATEDVQRLLEIREAAMEAFLKHTTAEVIRRASRARPRVKKEFVLGEKVFVFRKPLPRKGDLPDAESRKAVWCGPGTVVMNEGPNVWISMRGEMWKCSKEQVRSATAEEEEAYGLLEEEFSELRNELGRKGSKRAFKDISGWSFPPEDDAEEEPPNVRRRVEEEEGQPEPAEGSEEIEEEQEQVQQEDGQSAEGGTTSTSSTSSESKEEPEGERVEEEQLDDATRSVVQNERLDGLGGRGEKSFEPVRARVQSLRFKPYSFALWTCTEEETQKEGREEDYWVYLHETHSLMRVHVTPRRGRFVPNDKRGCPVPLRCLDSEMKIMRVFEDEKTCMEKVSWRRSTEEKEGPRRFWTGFTEFSLKRGRDEEKINWTMIANRGGDEVKESDILPEDWPKWRVSDGEEWSKVEASGAVQPLSIEESEEVHRQLKEAGTFDRVLPSTMVRRWKPAELPGEPPSMKSRWCVRGDKDPDVLSLERYAPTVTTSIIAVALQVASSMKFRCALGDLKNAFMQSDPLRREQGRLFCKQPAGGLPSLQAGQIIEILAGAYGLGDAPAHWRKSLKKVLLELGYEQSAMDPCSFRLFRGQELCGLVIVEVDDILSLGNQHHYEKMEILQKRFKFGKFKYLDEQPNGASFNGRRLRMAQDGTYLIDMQKFIEERLNEVPLEVGRAKMKEEEATEDEKKLTRAAIGALTWSAKEGRPDAAAAASLIASSLNTLRVQDILDLNKTIKEMKKSADLCLKIQPIEPSRMVWGVVTDASYANAKDKASQGAYGVICCDEDVLEGRKGVTNLIHWKSGKMHRIVNSTLAAESQSLSKGLSELAWTVTVYQEMITHNFDLKEWQTKVKQQRMVALAKTDSDSRLKRCLCVVDAKSLYDHLVKETVGTAEDRRTAIEMQVIRQAMGETGACIRWVPHPKMFMDCLTKRFGNRASLYDLLQSGKFSVCDDEVNNN